MHKLHSLHVITLIIYDTIIMLVYVSQRPIFFFNLFISLTQVWSFPVTSCEPQFIPHMAKGKVTRATFLAKTRFFVRKKLKRVTCLFWAPLSCWNFCLTWVYHAADTLDRARWMCFHGQTSFRSCLGRHRFFHSSDTDSTEKLTRVIVRRLKKSSLSFTLTYCRGIVIMRKIAWKDISIDIIIGYHLIIC